MTADKTASVASARRDVAGIDEAWREVRRAVEYGQWKEALVAVERVHADTERLAESLHRLEG